MASAPASTALTIAGSYDFAVGEHVDMVWFDELEQALVVRHEDHRSLRIT